MILNSRKKIILFIKYNYNQEEHWLKQIEILSLKDIPYLRFFTVFIMVLLTPLNINRS